MRTAIPNSNPILTASRIAFPEPTLPPNHVPIFNRDAAPGTAWCKRCEREVTPKQWAGEPCPGKAATR